MTIRKLLLVAVLASLSASAFADDCRLSKTVDCYFTAASIIVGADKNEWLPMGELYFKTDDGYSPLDRNIVIIAPKGQNSIFLYNRTTKVKSAEIAKNLGPSGNTNEAFVMTLSSGMATTSETHDETYTSCETSAFGSQIVTRLKTVKTINLSRMDGASLIDGLKSIKLTSEGNYRASNIPAKPVAACPIFKNQ